MTTLLVASTGGHLKELHHLRDRLAGVDGPLPLGRPSTPPQSRSLLAGEEVDFVPFVGSRDLVNVGAQPAAARTAILARSPRSTPWSAPARRSPLPFFALGRARRLRLPLHRERSAARRSLADRAADRQGLPGVHLYTQYRGWARRALELRRLGLRLLRWRGRRRRPAVADARSWSRSAPTAATGSGGWSGACWRCCRPRPRCSGRSATPTSPASASRPTTRSPNADLIDGDARGRRGRRSRRGRDRAGRLRGRQVPAAGAAPHRATASTSTTTRPRSPSELGERGLSVSVEADEVDLRGPGRGRRGSGSRGRLRRRPSRPRGGAGRSAALAEQPLGEELVELRRRALGVELAQHLLAGPAPPARAQSERVARAATPAPRPARRRGRGRRGGRRGRPRSARGCRRSACSAPALPSPSPPSARPARPRRSWAGRRSRRVRRARAAGPGRPRPRRSTREAISSRSAQPFQLRPQGAFAGQCQPHPVAALGERGDRLEQHRLALLGDEAADVEDLGVGAGACGRGRRG